MKGLNVEAKLGMLSPLYHLTSETMDVRTSVEEGWLMPVSVEVDEAYIKHQKTEICITSHTQFPYIKAKTHSLFH